MNLNRMLSRLTGFKVNRIGQPPRLAGVGTEDLAIIESVMDRTMTSPIRLLNAILSARYVAANRIPGAIVECGVWRGGTCMAMAQALNKIGVTDYDFYLFDTYQGMTPPGDVDRRLQDGRPASYLKWSLDDAVRQGNRFVNDVTAYSSIEDVREGMLSTGYPSSRIHLVPGDVSDTLNSHMPRSLALLRLDTDWYESTLHELEIGWPRLSTKGVLIVDDYDFWAGSRAAVDQYFANRRMHPLLVRMDEGRLVIKVEN